ncbi:MAG: hypothetical protein HKO55_02095 [Gammaproteobacteria bacterium]|nr:hypothetical protein [Gammaproteobacteria bacterium]
MINIPELPPALNRSLLLGLLGISAIVAWWASAYEMDAVWALKGFSPIAWVYQYWFPANFEMDFASGAENYRLSAFMHVYRGAYSLGIAPEDLVPFIIGFEVVLLSYAFYVLSRTLVPDAPLAVPVLVIIYVIASKARDLSLANFAEPYFTGQYYNVANALRILGIVMVLKRRPLPAAMLLAGSFATHATIGLMGVAFAFAMQLMRPGEMLARKYLVATAVFLLLAGAWVLLQFGQVSVATGEIPARIWLEMTRALNYHWYPVDNGVTTIYARRFVLPFLSFLLLLAYYWPEKSDQNDTRQKVMAGILAMLGLTIAGLAISVWLPVPFLIKLALHRANDLVVAIGLIYVVAGLWKDLTADAWWRRLLAATIMMSPWFFRPYPLLVSVLLVSPAMVRALGRRGSSPGDRVVTALFFLIAVICGIYLAMDVWLGLHPVTLLREPQGSWILPVFLLVCALSAFVFGKRTVGAVVLIAVLGAVLTGQMQMAEGREADRGRGYMHAQVWARENTAENALFMTDPTIYYGWRDFSRRSSFGNMREWLHTSWLYDADFDRYTEGLRRFNEFGIELQPYLKLDPPISAVGELTAAIKERYYSASDEWRADMAQRYGIDYFVFQRKDMTESTGLELVYENEHFIIFAAPD